MSILIVEIVNPKAKKLLQDLVELKLISIKKAEENPFISVVKKIRSRKARISIKDITKEVEIVRRNRSKYPI